MADEDVKKEEKKAEKEAEEASEAKSAEAKGEVRETPAEIETVNVDNETAEEASKQEVKEEKPKEKREGKKPEPTGKFKDLIKEIEGLTTIELVELVKVLEERFGVSAAAPVVAAPAAGSASAAPEEEEKAIYTVILTDSGAQKIAVIKALREINQELGLKEAKDIADAPPKEILKDAPKDKAEEAKRKLEAAGAKVELK